MKKPGEDERGQATAELAMLLPFVLILILSVGQVALVWRSQLLVTQAAREAARVGTVSSNPAAISRAAKDATGLDPNRIEVTIIERGAPGDLVVVVVRYRPVDHLPLVGFAVRDRVVSARATMLVES